MRIATLVRPGARSAARPPRVLVVGGGAARGAAERARFDAVVVDKELPRLSGLDLVSFLSHRAPATPIVLLTAFGGALVAEAARLRGATRHLAKPGRPAAPGCPPGRSRAGAAPCPPSGPSS